MGRFRSGRPRRLAVLVVGMLAVLAAGCGQQNASAPSNQSGAPVTINFRALQQGPNQMAPLVSAFEKAHPNIKVNTSYAPVESYGQALVTSLQAGNGPDVFYSNGGTGQPLSVLSLAKAGYLADLSQQPWAKSIPASTHNLYWSGSQLYGLPMAVNLAGAIYNVNAFKQLGLSVPTTFNQLLGMCKRIKGAGKVPMVLAGQAPQFYAEEPAVNNVYSADPSWNANRTAGKVTFAGSKGWRDSLQEFTQMNDAGCYQPGAAATTVNQAFNMMATEQALMFIAPAAAVGPIHGINPKVDVKMFPVPGPTPDATRALATFTDSYSVNARSDSAHKAAALTFLDFLAGAQQLRDYAKITGQVAIPDAVNGQVPSQYSAFAPYFKASKTVPVPYLSFPNSQVTSDLATGLQGLLTGQKGIDSVLSVLDRDWDRGSGS